MWHLTRVALRNRFVTILLAVILIAASIWATFQLKLEMIPDIELPLITVYTYYPDASADEVVSDITEPIEEAIWEEWEGKDLKQLMSTSADEISIIVAYFEFGTSMAEISDSIKQTVSGLELPPQVLAVPENNPQMDENPYILPIDIGVMMPLVFLTLSGDLPPDQLQDIADTRIVPALEQIEGVATPVGAEGGAKEQVLIAPDPEQISESGISIYQIAAMLSMNPKYSSLNSVENAPMGVDSLALDDIAGVSVGQPPRTVINRVNGENSVGIIVMKEKDANTVDVANAVIAKAEEIGQDIQGEYGDGVKLENLFAQSEFIEASIWELTQMALIGFALALIIVFMFLMAFRASLVTSMSIPFSIFIGFLVMHFSSITINLLTLSAMAIAVGRLIDNSIVIAEVIYRRLRQGEGFREAAVNGSKEIAAPITASTLATVAIFVPLAFVGGIIGEMFIPFALTITYALLASLFVALMIVPAFANWFVGRSRLEEQEEVRVEAGETWYQKLYTPSLKWALNNRAVTILIALVLFIGSGGLMPIIGTSFMPSMSEKMLVITVEMPPGTDIGTTSQVTAMVEALIDDSRKEIESSLSTIGTSKTMYGAMSAAMGGGDNTAEITIFLDQGADVDKERDDLDSACDSIRQQIGGDYILVETGEAQMSSQMGYTGLEVRITGDDFQALQVATDMLMDELEDIDGLLNLESELAMLVPKLTIDRDPAKIEALGLTEQQMQQLNNEFYLLRMGGPLTGVSVDIDGDSYGAFLKGIAYDLYMAEDPEALAKSISISFGWTQSVTLGDIADIELEQGLTHIRHYGTKLSSRIMGDITEKNIGAVNIEVQETIDELKTTPEFEGLEVKLGGVAEEMTEGFSAMGIAILIAIVIAYLILVVSMRSILNPLIIMVSLPLASIGALLALLISGYTLGMSAMMGVLMLVGIVLTNAIVLIALVEQLRTGGMGTYDALVEGGRTRLRPILMTALTTMIAMIPLAVGATEGTLLAAELAVVVIGGLFSSTLLTLLVIPVLYSLLDSLRQRGRKSG